MLDNWVHSFRTAGAIVLLGNAPADAVDAALQGSVGITHQRDNGPIAFLGNSPRRFPGRMLGRRSANAAYTGQRRPRRRDGDDLRQLPRREQCQW
jgi:hypothetical protein